MIRDAEGFRRLVLKRDGASVVRLGDVARVEMGAENYDSRVSHDGRVAVFVGINAAITANPLEVGRNVHALMPSIVSQLPEGMRAEVVFDGTKTIRESIDEVVKTLVEASLIVIVIIFLFLGSLRSVIVPVVTIPLSLIGVLSLMLWMGFSVNLLTLLAMVLAIGLVVDDAIVVVENIQRHIEEGLEPQAAALVGAREIAFPVIVDDADAGRGIRADRLPRRSHREAVHRVRVHAGRRGDRVGRGGADAVADDVQPAAAPRGIVGALRDVPGPLLRAAETALPAPARAHAREPARGAGVRAAVFVSLFFLFRAVPQELAPQEDTGHVYVVGPARSTARSSTPWPM